VQGEPTSISVLAISPLLQRTTQGFTIVETSGASIIETFGSDMDQMSGNIGHYPENLSGKKGVEPEIHSVHSEIMIIYW
jgi:hypothetical protein